MRLLLASIVLSVLFCSCETAARQSAPQGSQANPESVQVGGEVKVRAQHYGGN